MRRVIPLAAALVVLAGASSASAQTCNHHDGNCPYSVNYNAAGYGEISVCNIAENIDPQAVQHAMDAWNDMVGKPLLTASCAVPTGIVIVDKPEGYCGDVACAQYPQYEYPVLLNMFVEPGASGFSLECQKALMVHEIGHNLGFSHWSTCNSVMHATLCDCDFLEPTGVDLNNYLNAYSVEGVTSVTGSSSSPGAASLGWSTVNSFGQQICNEKEFGVWWLNPGTGSYDTHVATAGQNDTGTSFGDQPSGSQSYRVWSMTDALSPSFGGYAPPVPVNVRGPRVTAMYLFGPSPSKLSSTEGRYMWTIASIHNPDPAGEWVAFSAAASGHPAGCSQLKQLILPGVEQFWMSPGEEKWVLYRFRYECHSPAHGGVYYMPVELCVREASLSIDQHCRGYTRQLVVQ